jgi:hypothetical protein
MAKDDKPSGQKQPAGSDMPVSSDSDLTIIEQIKRCRNEADEAKRDRLWRNKINRDIYLGRQDWEHKEDGQSTEFLPKMAVSVEQMCSFIKKGLVRLGDYFTIHLDRSLQGKVSGNELREVLKCFLNDLWANGNNGSTDFVTVMSDGIKVALMESLIILKVHGGMQNTRTYRFEKADRATRQAEDNLVMEESEQWRLRIDLIRPEDYYPDPTGNGLYEIHRVEKDLHEVVSASEGENPLYDPEAVKRLIDTDYPRPMDEERRDEAQNQPETTNPSHRKRVVLDEFWGTLLNQDGTIAQRNIVCTVANDKIVIRKPTPNPFWHQESPFVVAPLIRVPFSVWHKALYDHAAELNLSINEFFNLILDGGLASVWGIRQVRVEDLEDPGQVAGGIPQGATLAVKQTLPHDAKVVETVTTGNVPQDAMQVYEAISREYTGAALTNELKMGQLPAKRVLATEIVEASQSQSVTLDGLIGDIENNIIKVALRKAWLTILQNADDIPEHQFTSAISQITAMLIMKASPEERFALFAGKSQFRVSGLSESMAKAMDFQKKMALAQAAGSNPLLMEPWMTEMSGKKFLDGLIKDTGLNPDEFKMDEEEKKQVPEKIARTGILQGMLGQQGGGQAAAPGAETPEGGAPVGTGGSEAATINQLAGPSGMVPNA